MSLVSLFVLFNLRHALLAITIDPLSARVQGLPVRGIGLMFSIIIAIVVVSMVKVVGALLVTALLVTPAATAQLIGRSFKIVHILGTSIRIFIRFDWTVYFIRTWNWSRF